MGFPYLLDANAIASILVLNIFEFFFVQTKGSPLTQSLLAVAIQASWVHLSLQKAYAFCKCILWRYVDASFYTISTLGAFYNLYLLHFRKSCEITFVSVRHSPYRNIFSLLGVQAMWLFEHQHNNTAIFLISQSRHSDNIRANNIN
jgi:hypothetical protein